MNEGVDTTMHPDPPSQPHRGASPYISLHVLYSLCATARAAGVTHLSVDELETACDNYREVMGNATR